MMAVILDDNILQGGLFLLCNGVLSVYPGKFSKNFSLLDIFLDWTLMLLDEIYLLPGFFTGVAYMWYYARHEMLLLQYSLNVN